MFDVIKQASMCVILTLGKLYKTGSVTFLLHSGAKDTDVIIF